MGAAARGLLLKQGALAFYVNSPVSNDSWARLGVAAGGGAFPSGFGSGEFAIDLELNPEVGRLTGTGTDRWTTMVPNVYGTPDWWYVTGQNQGNFVIDGHNNNAFENGTLSLVMYNDCRPCWLFGDGAPAGARTGDLHAVYNNSAASLRTGNYSYLRFVRRSDGGSGAILESWAQGILLATETSSAMTDMTTWWGGSWTGFPSTQFGWYLGAEKQSALNENGITQYQAFSGRIRRIRLWNRAPSTAECQNYKAVSNTNQLVADFNMSPLVNGRTKCNIRPRDFFIETFPQSNPAWVEETVAQ